MRTNAISDNEFGWGCWSINLPQSNKGQDRAANVSQHSDIASRTSFQAVGKINNECGLMNTA